ncbi:MAG: hypothetical protein IKZ88_09100 [Neisseriaceae bacterium]|nr:hypothetical protein [Neisseriaceae bacterium]
MGNFVARTGLIHFQVVGWVSNPPFAQRAKIKLLSFYQSTPYGVVVG